ncbi:patatin-like phospholipase : Uncharacterized protein OS=Candidatus Nitrospira defluvii GN=NIDE0582 PE=4 SV=1 [Gemmata massiliana]|uniref:Patatin-like phospholipase: Uncharacterized protein n=1 Tax=Gemmata massiliana TaxID=1210884 RepID=A0A6P2D8I7_9BACT|nr:hypothetical protein [Gemmata massiliana]VTR95800.1 patatin-like phospholipase : Uncharacterized protein OS=Candidatus Nitrospira defluvii GN=NIDE0582 PE=4 SV=1 [Gemmata massiliana]
MYANRLIRCYLGASRHNHRWANRGATWGWADGPTGAPTGVPPPPRSANEFTDFDARDDLPLVRLRLKNVPRVDEREPEEPRPRGYYGPYPLINTTLNLVAGAALAEQDRKGESFVLTPDYCGTPRTGFARLPESEKSVGNMTEWENLTLGRAVAISGAAIDPNMKFYQSAPLTALLTLLNLRLGWWIENPRSPGHKRADDNNPWGATNPKNGALLWNELSGQTEAGGPYIHLSDGGHFENTGAYELIRRRCRFVVVVDAAEDALDASENLANLIRLVRTDFGIRIEIDTTPIRKNKDKLSNAHAVAGVIRYDDVDDRGVNGTLVFIRSSLTGDEPADVKNYAANNPQFPHHPTLPDQFFDEDQFESYRALGFHIGLDVFAQAAAEVRRFRPSRGASDVEYNRRVNRRLFAEVRRNSVQATPEQFENYISAPATWSSWVDVIRSDQRLAPLNREFYPEIVPFAATDRLELAGLLATIPDDISSYTRDGARITLARVAAGADGDAFVELRVMSQLVGVMEAAWMRLNLSVTFPGPLQRGWMNCFRRWTATRVFQRYWPVLRPEYSAGFARFCERVLNMPLVPVRAVRWSRLPEHVQTQVRTELNREFFGDWASVFTRPDALDHDWSENYLWTVVEDSLKLKGSSHLTWVLTYGQPGERGGLGLNDQEPEKDPFMWEETSGGRAPSFPIGVAAVRRWIRPNQVGEYELLFWIRPGYRTSEVGQQILPLLLKQIDAELPPGEVERFLITRFPKLSGTPADSLQRALWAIFFNDNDFFRYACDSEVAENEVRLRRRVT